MTWATYVRPWGKKWKVKLDVGHQAFEIAPTCGERGVAETISDSLETALNRIANGEATHTLRPSMPDEVADTLRRLMDRVERLESKAHG